MDNSNPVEQARKSNTAFLIVSIVIIGALFSYYGLFSPRGIIVADHGDNSSARIGEYSYRITASIQNDGQSGEITLTAGLRQGGNYWKKTLTKHIERNHVEIYVIDFDEVELFGGEASYTLSCSP